MTIRITNLTDMAHLPPGVLQTVTVQSDTAGSIQWSFADPSSGKWISHETTLAGKAPNCTTQNQFVATLEPGNSFEIIAKLAGSQAPGDTVTLTLYVAKYIVNLAPSKTLAKPPLAGFPIDPNDDSQFIQITAQVMDNTLSTPAPVNGPLKLTVTSTPTTTTLYKDDKQTPLDWKGGEISPYVEFDIPENQSSVKFFVTSRQESIPVIGAVAKGGGDGKTVYGDGQTQLLFMELVEQGSLPPVIMSLDNGTLTMEPGDLYFPISFPSVPTQDYWLALDVNDRNVHVVSVDSDHPPLTVQVANSLLKFGAQNKVAYLYQSKTGAGSSEKSVVTEFVAQGSSTLHPDPADPARKLNPRPYLNNHAQVLNSNMLATDPIINLDLDASIVESDTIAFDIYLNGYKPGSADPKSNIVPLAAFEVTAQMVSARKLSTTVPVSKLHGYDESPAGQPGFFEADYTVTRGSATFKPKRWLKVYFDSVPPGEGNGTKKT